MKKYVLLLRGINVGGKAKVSMAELKKSLEKLGYANVTTYINSGNVLVESALSPEKIRTEVETTLQKNFNLDAVFNKVLVLSYSQLKAAIDDKPKGFGEEPDTYYSDVIFLIDTTAAAVMPVFDPREGVDAVWPGKGVVYSQRLSSQRTKSRLSKIVASPFYKSMTIRSWSTTTKLLKMLEEK